MALPGQVHYHGPSEPRFHIICDCCAMVTELCSENEGTLNEDWMIASFHNSNGLVGRGTYRGPSTVREYCTEEMRPLPRPAPDLNPTPTAIDLISVPIRFVLCPICARRLREDAGIMRARLHPRDREHHDEINEPLFRRIDNLPTLYFSQPTPVRRGRGGLINYVNRVSRETTSHAHDTGPYTVGMGPGFVRRDDRDSPPDTPIDARHMYEYLFGEPPRPSGSSSHHRVERAADFRGVSIGETIRRLEDDIPQAARATLSNPLYSCTNEPDIEDLPCSEFIDRNPPPADPFSDIFRSVLPKREEISGEPLVNWLAPSDNPLLRYMMGRSAERALRMGEAAYMWPESGNSEREE